MFSNCSGLFLLSLQFLFPWLTLCSKRPCTYQSYGAFQLTKESLADLTFYLTGGSTGTQSTRLPADFVAKLSWKLRVKYVIGSAAVLGSVDRRALGVIRWWWRDNKSYWVDLLEELAWKNDLDTVAHFIARNAGRPFWNNVFGRNVVRLMKDNWGAMCPLSEKVLAILKESGDRSKDYDVLSRCVPAELQYERISSGETPLDEIDKICPLDGPHYRLLKEIFFRARCSPNPNPQIREHIAEKVPWFKQFMPEEIPSSAKDTCVTSIVEPGHDVWVRIRSFMDAETLIFVWPSVCRTWNKSYSKMLAEDTRVQEWFLQDLSRIDLDEIRTIAPWNRFLNENNSAAYIGQCIVNGSLGRIELDGRLWLEVRDYLYYAIRGNVPIPKVSKEFSPYDSVVKLIEEGCKVCPQGMPTLVKPPFLNDEDHERLIHYIVCEKKLAVRISCQWIIDNIPRIYSVLGEDQVVVRKVIDVSANGLREVLFVWIMIGQACGMTEDTAKSVFNKPGIFIEKFIRPVFIRPSEYYDYIAESGMLFDMIKIYYGETAYEISEKENYPIHELNRLMISLILFFKDRPHKIEKIVASMISQLPTLENMLVHTKDRFGTITMNILAGSSKHSPEDAQFVRNVLTRCGLLDRIAE